MTVFPFNGYSIVYAELFERFREKPINILEIGLARRTDRNTLGLSCPSLKMWTEYFPKGNVYGFDIDNFSSVNLPRTQIFRGDQGNPHDLLKIIAKCARFDVIIADGSHPSYHQQVALKTLFPYLASNGLYLIEDIHWQAEALEANLPPVCKTRDLLKNSSALNQMISKASEISFFTSPIKGCRGSVAIISKE